MSWLSVDPDMTGDWHEIVDYVLGVCEAAGKTTAGQEGSPAAVRASRDVVLEDGDGQDTGDLRKGPSSEWRWSLVILLSYPGRQKRGSAGRALADAVHVAAALTTANPERGWRPHVGRARIRQEGDHYRVRLTVEVLHIWRHGPPAGLDADSAEAQANGGLS